jgi:hypothetical protein
MQPHTVRGTPYSSEAVADGKVYVGLDNSYFYA